MAAQVFLFTPADADTAFVPGLEAVLDAVGVAALLVRRGQRSDADYEPVARAMVAAGQKRGAAVLIEGEPALAKRLGADGIHVSALAALKPAIAALKPAQIVGMGPLDTNHDAMVAGEDGADYVMFGWPDRQLSDDDRDRALWWAQTFEVPAVLCDPGADAQTIDPLNCEFIGLAESVWQAPEGAAKRLAALNARLQAL